MPELMIRHTLKCDAEAYWRCVFDEQYNRRLYLDILKFREFKMLSHQETADGSTRRIHLNPPATELPAPVAKVVGDLSWVEDGTYTKATRRYRFKCIPASMPDKTQIAGELWCESRGPKTIERIARIKIEVKVFVVGALVEKRISEDTQRSYDEAAKFTEIYVKEKGW